MGTAIVPQAEPFARVQPEASEFEESLGIRLRRHWPLLCVARRLTFLIAHSEPVTPERSNRNLCASDRFPSALEYGSVQATERYLECRRKV
jgi:hypothetical protein